MFSETLQNPSGKRETMVSFQLAYYSAELQYGLCTSLAHGRAWDSVTAGDDKLFHYLWLSCIYYHQTRQQLIIKEKKSSPMISLTSLFCHRLIQNSFQVTSTVLQSGNVLAATKGTSVWASALPAGQAAARSQPGILRSQPSLLPQMACSLERNTICRTQAPRDSLSTGANRQCSANLRQPKVSGCREFIYNSAAVRREQH